MSYLLLIVEPVNQRAERTPAEGDEVYGRMMKFGESLAERGVLRAAESLSSTRKATRLQKRSGRSSLLDGPFAEAKEMIGGFFLVDVPTFDDAVAIAAECPAAEWCTVEVREIGPCFA